MSYPSSCLHRLASSSIQLQSLLLYRQELIVSAQLLLTMLISSAVRTSLSALHSNLPTVPGIFPAGNICIIVPGMQLSRLSVLLVAAGLLLVAMQMQM